MELKAISYIRKYASLILVLLFISIVWYFGQSGQGVSYEAFLGTIGQSLATILAIVFALILIPIQHFAEKYTVEVLKEFKRDLYVKGLFFLISSVSLMAFFLLGLYNNLSLYFTLTVFTLTVLCLYAVYLFYFYVVDLLDPRKIVRKKCRHLAKAITQDSPITSPNPQGNSMLNELDIPEQIVLKSIERNETDIATDSIAAVVHLTYLITGRTRTPQNAQFLERIIGFYLRALFHTLKYDNQAKFLLIYLARDVIFLRIKTNPFNKEYLHDMMQYLYNANKLIIDSKDMGLFKAQLDYFSSHVDKDGQVEKELYDVFCMVGSYALCSESKEQFVKAIWTNIPQEGTGIAFVGNKNLVNFDIGFLSQQLVRLSELDRYISEIFSGIRPCILKYYVLCLTYARHTLGKTWEISIPEPTDQKKELYLFFEQMKSIKKELQSKCDELKEEATKWSDVIKPKEIAPEKAVPPSAEGSSVTRIETTRIDTRDTFENTKKWLDEMNATFEDKGRILLQLLPLDAEKVRECRDGILNNYKGSSIVSRVINSRIYDEEKDQDKKFLQIGGRYLIDRFWFTSPTALPLFSELGRNVAIGEENYMLDQIQKRQGTRFVRQITYESIKSFVDELKKEAFKPSVLFAPIDYFVSMQDWKTKLGETLSTAVKYESGKPYLLIDESTKLELFWSSNYVKLDSFVIVDQSFGEWIIKPSVSGELLTVEIKENAEDSTKVDILVKATFRLEVVKKDATRIIKKE